TEHNPKPSFRKSFAEAKKGGHRKFTWDGKTYNTQTAAEKAKKSNAPHLVLRARKAAADVKKNPKSKSHKEIYQSYEKETKKRFGGASSKDIYKAAKPPM
ncbi:MAG: hypothetical protein IIB56_19245, partial [Planctomycetes bacterium]|nr:hypothetical protein [Planctomycetota bacterium]